MKILIVKLSAIGDVIHTLPALTALRRYYPDARIDWLFEDGASDLVQGHAALIRALVWRRREFVELLKTGRLFSALRLFLSLLLQLRDTRYDLLLDFQALLKSSLWICVNLIDIGTQESTWEGKTNYKRQVVVMWELPNCLMEEGEYAGKPFIVSKFYTASLSEKSNLRHDLEAWRGKAMTPDELAGFDAKNILGKPCMLGITEGKNGKSRVTTVMQLPKGMPVPDQINPTVYFSLDDFNQEVFDSLSKGIKAMIEKSPEYQAIGQKGNGFEDLADDLPWGETGEHDDAGDRLPF